MAKAAPKRGKNKDNARRSKKKISILTQEKVEYVDFKDVNLLRRFMSDRAKIRARRVTGNDSQQQKEIARAIKNAGRWPCCRTPTGSPPRGAAAGIVETAGIVATEATAGIVVTEGIVATAGPGARMPAPARRPRAPLAPPPPMPPAPRAQLMRWR